MKILVLSMVAKALLIWFAILVMAIANGTLREAVLVPFLGKFPGFILSGMLLSLIIVAITYFTLPWFGSLPFAGYITIGCGWLLLTLIFEFTFGHYVQQKPWSELLQAYAFKDGNIWPIVLIVTAMAPYIAAKIRELI